MNEQQAQGYFLHALHAELLRVLPDAEAHELGASVREFTRAVPKAKVVRLGSLMRPGPVPEGAPLLTATTTVAEARAAFLGGAEVVGIIDGDTRLGTVGRDAVIHLLLGGEA